jgi:hypothetical protein
MRRTCQYAADGLFTRASSLLKEFFQAARAAGPRPERVDLGPGVRVGRIEFEGGFELAPGFIQ